ncbi:unnamed protein product, partial [Phaeothamnion confervicola]
RRVCPLLPLECSVLALDSIFLLMQVRPADASVSLPALFLLLPLCGLGGTAPINGIELCHQLCDRQRQHVRCIVAGFTAQTLEVAKLPFWRPTQSRSSTFNA